MAAYDLTTLGNVRSFIQKATADTAQDALISALISRASMAIMRYADREFAPASAANTIRRFEVMSDYVVDFTPRDLQTAALVQLHPETTSPVTLTANVDYSLRPVDAPLGVYSRMALSRQLSFSSTYAVNIGRPLIDVKGTWGFATIPDEIEQACIVTVAIWLRRDVQAFTATFNIDEARLERPMALPSSVVAMVDPFKRMAF